MKRMPYTFKRALIRSLAFNGLVIIAIFLITSYTNKKIRELAASTEQYSQEIKADTNLRTAAQELETQMLRTHFVMQRETHPDLDDAKKLFLDAYQPVFLVWAKKDIDNGSPQGLERREFITTFKNMMDQFSVRTISSEESSFDRHIQSDANYDFALRRDFLPYLQNEIDRTKTLWAKDSSHLTNLQVSTNWTITILLFVVLAVNAISLMGILSTLHQRLSKISLAFRELSQGNLKYLITIDGSDELSTLSLGFNEMAQTLSKAQDQIELQKSTLINTSKFSALGQMAAGIAHEINNPLAIIQGKAHTLVRKISLEGKIEKEKVLQDVERIVSTTERISNIIKGLKTFSRSAEGDPFTENFLRQIIDDTVSFCGYRFKNEGIDFRIKGKGETPDLMVNCRPTQLSQVLTNLLNNACDAIEFQQNKWIQLEVTHGDLGFFQILVTDSGGPIPSEIADKLMQPFFTTKGVDKGTGLGLSISRGIIQDHGGTLILNRESPNTQFIIELPIYRNQHRSS